MIEIKELNFSYSRNKTILQDIAFSADTCECTAILGNNGAGKSTLLKCLNRILTPQKGSVYIGENDVLEMSFNAVAKNMAFVAQDVNSVRLTVYDTIMLGRKPYISWGIRSEDEKVVLDIIQQMNLEDMAVRFMDELSGGEQQKVMLARAIAQQPKVLLLDEPTSNLDLKNQYEVLSLVSNLCKNNNIAVIIVIHDLNLALRFCDKFILIKDTKIFDYGSEKIITRENIQEVYGISVGIHTLNGHKVVVPE